MALSVALLGGIAASQLGRAGSRILYTGGHGMAAAHAAADYATGYEYAMLTGAGLALVGALASLTRGPAAQATAAPSPSGRPATQTARGRRRPAGRHHDPTPPHAIVARRGAGSPRLRE